MVLDIFLIIAVFLTLLIDAFIRHILLLFFFTSKCKIMSGDSCLMQTIRSVKLTDIKMYQTISCPPKKIILYMIVLQSDLW